MSDLLTELRGVISQDIALPALRASTFFLGLVGGWFWHRGARGLAFGALLLGSTFALSFWLVQISAPFGLGTDPTRSSQWAQAGTLAAGASKQGFIWGTPMEASFLAEAAALGLPWPWIKALPQIAVFACMFLVAFLPLTALGNRATRLFASCIAMGGGLWPGIEPYDSLLLRPWMTIALFASALLAHSLVARRHVSNQLHRHLIVGLVVAAVVAQAFSTVIGGSALSTSLLMWATLELSSPLRVAIRRLGHPPNASKIEGAILIVVFTGSGLFWWTPSRTAPGFLEARTEGQALQKPMAWIASHVPRGDLVIASPTYSAQIAALAGRLVLFAPEIPGEKPTPLPEPFRRDRLYASTLQGRPIARLAEGFSASHLFLGPGEATPLATKDEPTDEPRMSLELVYQDVEDFRVFRLAKK